MQVSAFHPPDSQFQPEPSGGVPECSTWSVALSSSHEETKKKISKKKKKSMTSVSFPARSWPTNLLTQLQQRFA
jgi:hypothetical protein